MTAGASRDSLRPDDYPAEILKAWAQEDLGIKRCSAGHLGALASILRRMRGADLHGARIEFGTIAPYASRQTLRNLLLRLSAAGLMRRGTDLKRAKFTYQGEAEGGQSIGAAAEYARIQREGEDAAFQRYVQRVGVCPDDCPY